MGSLGTFAGGTETSKRTRVGGEILLVLARELLDEVVGACCRNLRY